MLQEKLRTGFSESCLRTEQKIVVEQLRKGRITRDKWEEYREKITDNIDKLEQNEITSEQYLDNRKDLIEQISNEKSEKTDNITRKEALKMYNEIRDDQKESLLKVNKEKEQSSLKVLYKTLENKFTLRITQFKNL